jgi:hypothetical protein
MKEFKIRIALSGGPLEEAEGEGWDSGVEKAFADPTNERFEVIYRRLPEDDETGVDPLQAVYCGRRRVQTA